MNAATRATGINGTAQGDRPFASDPGNQRSAAKVASSAANAVPQHSQYSRKRFTLPLPVPLIPPMSTDDGSRQRPRPAVPSPRARPEHRGLAGVPHPDEVSGGSSSAAGTDASPAWSSAPLSPRAASPLAATSPAAGPAAEATANIPHAKILQEFRRRTPQGRPPRGVFPAARDDQVVFQQHVQCLLRQARAAHVLDLRPRDRLVVGDDRQRLQRHPRQPARTCATLRRNGAKSAAVRNCSPPPISTNSMPRP